ncbi:hypothetical protein Mal4_25130 [Maioricimonas rarisocia]|uniref:Sigma 54 modulation protein / S30EA ribosomal protein n=1 Tax=Maioricimonas rarisocia TaxID=2528026 RepID=A0A517Z6X3_9PLAN|nr:hypothetical protein [Maioricimonas rarisocia]QDU38189.1 hypothetical protein Mal4_25130 [Maioricimonas rarisocia]
MKYSDQSYNLKIDLDIRDCDLTPAEIEKFESDLNTLARLVEDFPVSDLHITIAHFPRSTDYHVKTALVLPGRTMVTADRHQQPHPAYERCIRKLVHKVSAYKAKLGNADKVAKEQEGTHFQIEPTRVPDVLALRQAVDDNDYIAFRRECDVYSEPLRKRVGRWIQRYPALEARIGEQLSIADIVDEVLINAFDRFDQKPDDVPISDWLEHLVEPSLADLVRHIDEELENISQLRTWMDVANNGQV